MSGLQAGFTRMASLEEGLAATLTRASDDLAHTERFDSEQRAEVYAIIEAIRANSQSHLAMVSRLAEQIRTGKGNA